MFKTNGIMFVVAVVFAVLFGGCQESSATQTSTQASTALASAAIAETPTPMATPASAPIEVKTEPVQIKTEGKRSDYATAAPVAETRAARNGAAIEVTKEAHDFGDLAPDSMNSCKFTFKNAGTEVLKIEQVQSTCGCSVPTLKKTEFQPGEEGEVEVRFHAPNYKGTTTKHLYIVSNDTKNPRAQLEIKANVVVMVEVSPEQVDLVYNKENAGIVPLTLKSLDGQPFAVTGVTTTNNAIQIDFDPEKKATEFVLHPTVDTELLSKFPVGTIQIKVDHPKTKQVIAQYRMQPRFVVSRPRIIMQNAQPGSTDVKDVLIRSNYGEKVEIESASSRGGTMEIVETQEVEGDALKVMVKITVPPQDDSNRRYFSDELDIKLTNGFETQIRCSGWYKR